MGLPGPNSLLRRHCLLELRDFVVRITGSRVIAESIIRTFWSYYAGDDVPAPGKEGPFDLRA